MAKQDLLLELREGRPLALRQQTALTLQLSFPAILAQISSIVMQYIDAAMVGQLGRDASAAIGLVASSTWLFGGLCRALVVGFSVMVAQRIGAGEEKDARNLVKQGLCAGFAFGLLIAAVGGAIASGLPHWLHADSSICPGASSYFLIFALSLPFVQLNRLAVGLLQAGGNMRTPSILLVLMCGLDVVFNSLLIFPTRQLGTFTLPGADLGVTGAALGTALSETVVAIILCICLLRSPMLGLRKGERLRFVPVQLRRAVRLGAPVAIEQAVMSSAQVVTTRIIAPLGTVAIAANSFAVTAEALCYMPGYGVQSAAVTLIGQSVGAKRKDLVTRLGWVTVLLGMGVMLVASALMYALAPWIIGMLSPDRQVVLLGTQVLRIVVFSEPLFGASIVTAGVFQGAGSSLLSSVLNFVSMWGVRITLTLLLVPHWGCGERGSPCASSCASAVHCFYSSCGANGGCRGSWCERKIPCGGE